MVGLRPMSKVKSQWSKVKVKKMLKHLKVKNAHKHVPRVQGEGSRTGIQSLLLISINLSVGQMDTRSEKAVKCFVFITKAI